MTDKHAAARMLDRLASELSELRKAPKQTHDTTWRARRDALLAESGHWLRLVLPADSPLIPLVGPPTDARADDRGDGGTDEYRLEMAASALRAAIRSNEVRGDERAMSGLSEDVDRILAKRFYRHPIVLASMTAVTLAAAFAVLGVVRFYGMELDIKGEIEKRRDAVRAELVEMQKGTDDTRTQLEEVSSGVREAKTSLTNLQAQTESEIERLGRSMTKGAQASVENVVAAATQSIDKARKDALATIQAAGSTDALARAQDEARKEIGRAAKERADEVKAQKTPEFDEALDQDQARLTKLESGLGELESRSAAIDAALAVIANTDSSFIEKLAAYYREAVVSVYLGLGVVVVLFAADVVLLVMIWRLGGAWRLPQRTGAG